MTVSIWQANGQQSVREVDVLVVGAGLIGCASAYFAKQVGHEVVITEKRDVALGASGRNAGFMITGIDTHYHRAIEQYGRDTAREMWAMSRKAMDYWRGFVQESQGAVQYDPCGSHLLAETEEEAQELELAARELEADGVEIHYHSKDPLGRGYYAAIEQPGDAGVQPYELTQAICQQSSAELIANNELYHFEQTEPECVTVYTRQFIFKARRVLLCTNAYSPFIDPYFIGKVIPTRAQCLVTAPLDKPVLATCGYSDYGYMYYRMTFDGRLLIGGGRKQHKELEGNTSEDRTTDPVQNELDAYLKNRFPDAQARVERRWAGIMGFSVDGLPLVGTLPEKPRVGFAVGFTGHGLSLGASVAERAVGMLLNGTHPGVVCADRLH